MILQAHIALINIAAFALCGMDKRHAAKGKGRIRERTLLLIAALGGSPGLLAGMLTFRHKTRKPGFYIGVPAILAAQLLIVYFILRYA